MDDNQNSRARLFQNYRRGTKAGEGEEETPPARTPGAALMDRASLSRPGSAAAAAAAARPPAVPRARKSMVQGGPGHTGNFRLPDRRTVDTSPGTGPGSIDKPLPGTADKGNFSAVVQALLGRRSDNPLIELAQEASRIVGTDYVGPLNDERYQEVIDSLSLELKGMDEPILGLLHNAVLERQEMRFPQLLRQFEGALQVGDFDAAEQTLHKLSRAKHDPQRLALCDADLASARRRHEERERFRARLRDARSLVKPGAFLESLRDARSIFDALLDDAPHFQDLIDIDELRRERDGVDRRIQTEERAQDEISTMGALDELGPNLRALEDYESRRARGERMVRFDGPDLVPVDQAIHTLTMRVRPKVRAVVSKHLTDAERLLDAHGNVEASVKRLSQRRDWWHLLENEFSERLEERFGELTEAVEKRAREAALTDRIRLLLDEGRFEQALNELDLGIAGQGPSADTLERLRSTVLQRWLSPFRAKVRLLTTRLGDIHPNIERVRAIRESIEQLEEEMAEVTGTPPGISELRGEAAALAEQANALEARLERCDKELARAEKLAKQGRLEEVRKLLDALADEVPERRADIAASKQDFQFEIQRDEALALARKLLAQDPERALELCEPYAAHDGAFAELALIAERRRALNQIEQYEQRQDYDAVVQVARALVDRLQGDERAEFEALIEHYGAVRDHVELAKQNLPKAREAIRQKDWQTALDLLDGLALARREHAEAEHIRRQAVAALSTARRAEVEATIEQANGEGAARRLEAVRTAVEFLRRYTPQVPDNQVVVDRFDFARAMAVAREHLETGDVEKAIETARGLMGLGAEANVAGFINEARIRRFVIDFRTAFSTLDIDRAEQLVRESELGAATEVVEARKLVSDARGVFRILDKGDALEAWRQAYALVYARHGEEPPEYLREFLERVRQQRIGAVLAACEALRVEAQPGYTFEQIEQIVRDVEARAPWEDGAELEGLIETVHLEQAADFDALCNLARELAKGARPDREVVDRTIRRLTLAAKHQEDDEDRAQAQELIRPLRDRQAAAQRTSDEENEVQALVEDALQSHNLGKLERALRMQTTLGGETAEIKALLDGWHEADRIVRALEAAIAEGDFDAADDKLDALEELRSKVSIPHPDSLAIDDRRLGRLGPGASAVRLQLDSLRHDLEDEQNRIGDTIESIEHQVEQAERRRAELMKQVRIDEPEQGVDDARREAESLAEALRGLEQRADALRSKLRSQELLDALQALVVRARKLGPDALADAVRAERKALEIDFGTLQTIYRQDPQGIRARADDVLRIAERWSGSGRIAVWSRAIKAKVQ